MVEMVSENIQEIGVQELFNAIMKMKIQYNRDTGIGKLIAKGPSSSDDEPTIVPEIAGEDPIKQQLQLEKRLEYTGLLGNRTDASTDASTAASTEVEEGILSGSEVSSNAAGDQQNGLKDVSLKDSEGEFLREGLELDQSLETGAAAAQAAAREKERVAAAAAAAQAAVVPAAAASRGANGENTDDAAGGGPAPASVIQRPKDSDQIINEINITIESQDFKGLSNAEKIKKLTSMLEELDSATARREEQYRQERRGVGQWNISSDFTSIGNKKREIQKLIDDITNSKTRYGKKADDKKDEIASSIANFEKNEKINFLESRKKILDDELRKLRAGFSSSLDRDERTRLEGEIIELDREREAIVSLLKESKGGKPKKAKKTSKRPKTHRRPHPKKNRTQRKKRSPQRKIKWSKPDTTVFVPSNKAKKSFKKTFTKKRRQVMRSTFRV
jgi:hypothetical protein